MVEKIQEKFPNLSGRSVLVLDDDPAIVRGLTRVLSGLGAQVTGVGSLREARLVLETLLPDSVLADLQLKDGIGIELLPDYLAHRPDGAFYMITGHGSVGNAVEALRLGARHYFEKPVDPIEVARHLAQDLPEQETTSNLMEQLNPYLVVRDPLMIEALSELPHFAISREPVLIDGETGTGKELVARALHGLSTRAEGPFVAVNCGAIPETMLEAELFGYEKGAFTGATRTHLGRFEQAHKGTLFLDEIGEMPPSAQVSLLRILEEGQVHRVGSERGIPVDVRIVAATHRPLQERIESQLFRQDLLFRLNVLLIHLPPLRKRPLDIEVLAHLFLTRSLRDRGLDCTAPVFSPEALAFLSAYHWPGNVRELRNLMTRLAIRLPHNVREICVNLLKSLLQTDLTSNAHRTEGVLIPKNATLAQAEWLLIDAALKEANFNRSKAAKLLGIGERTLRRKLNES